MTISSDESSQDSSTAGTIAADTSSDMSSKRKATIGALMLVIVAAAVLLFTIGGRDDPETTATGEFSEFHLTVVETFDGGTTDFTHLAGKPVILNFFASWCAPCKAEMPTLEGLHKTLGDELAVVGLNIEGVRPALETIEETGVTYFAALDADGILLERYDGFGMPTTVFIDANGDVVDSHVGELTDGAFRDRIRDLFGIGDV